MDLNKIKAVKETNSFYIGLNDHIKHCLTPIFHFHCLDIMPYDPELMNSILMYIAMNDNRLTYFMYGTTK